MGRVLIRSAVLVALGYALTCLDTSVDVILAAYGTVFLLALPLYRLRADTLAVIAAATALYCPRSCIRFEPRSRVGAGPTPSSPTTRWPGSPIRTGSLNCSSPARTRC